MSKCRDCGGIIPRNPRDMDRCNSCYWKDRKEYPKRVEKWRREFDEAVEKMRRESRNKSDGRTK